jgi:hypothetical protein
MAPVQGAHGGGGLRIAAQPPCPTGIGAFRPHSATRARVGCKSIQIKPRKKAWISLDSFGRIGAFQWLQRKQIKKSSARSARLRGCAQTPVPDAFPPSLAPSDPSIVNWSPQKDIAYVSGFVNELDCGLEVGDQIRMSHEACAGRSRLNGGGDEVGGSSSVVVGLATTLPPSPPREEPGARVPVRARKHFRRNLRRGRRAERAIVEASSSPSASRR